MILLTLCVLLGLKLSNEKRNDIKTNNSLIPKQQLASSLGKQ